MAKVTSSFFYQNSIKKYELMKSIKFRALF